MVVSSVISFTLVFHPLVAFGQTDVSTKPRIYKTKYSGLTIRNYRLMAHAKRLTEPSKAGYLVFSL